MYCRISQMRMSRIFVFCRCIFNTATYPAASSALSLIRPMIPMDSLTKTHASISNVRFMVDEWQVGGRTHGAVNNENATEFPWRSVHRLHACTRTHAHAHAHASPECA